MGQNENKCWIPWGWRQRRSRAARSWLTGKCKSRACAEACPSTLISVSPELSAFQKLPSPILEGLSFPWHHQSHQLRASAHAINWGSGQLIRVFPVVWPQQLITGISRGREPAPIRAIPALLLEQPRKKWFYYTWVNAWSAWAPVKISLKTELCRGQGRKEDRAQLLSSVRLCDPLVCSPPGSSVREILQTRILDWVAVPFSRGSSSPRNWTRVSCLAGRFFTIWDTTEAQNED